MTTSPKYTAALTVVSNQDVPKKTPVYGCCAAWMWLAVIVAIKTLLIVAWITKEYYFLDFTCAIIVKTNTTPRYHYDKNADTVLVRNRRNLIPKPSLFRPSSLVDFRRHKRDAGNVDVWWKRFQKDVSPRSSFPINRNSTESGQKRGKKHRKGKGSKKNRRKESAEDHAMVTKFPEKRFHLLGGADINLDLRVESTTRPAHQSSWIDGIIDTRDPGFSNKGEIRAYSMKVAKKIPQPDAEMIRNLIDRQEAKNVQLEESPLPPTVPNTPPEPSSLPESPTIGPNIEESTITTEEVSPRPMPAVQMQTSLPEPVSSKTNPSHTTGPTANVVPERKIDFQPRPLDVVVVKDLGLKTPPPTERVKPETTTEVITIPPPTPMPKHKRKENFTIQLNVFTSNALCIARTMTALWCAAQCATLIPFLLGVCAGLKCLLAPHFILDALFLVVAFIASITITVFSIMLYTIVDEMPAPTLLEWIVFAVVVDVILVFYTIAFTVSLRCAEIVFDRPYTYASKSSNSHTTSSYHLTSPLNGSSVNGGPNEQFV